MSEFEIDPLHDSDTEQRAKLAAQRTARADAGTPVGSNAASGTVHKARVNSSYQRYLFGSAGSSGKPTWSDSMKGRAAIRLVSRGIFGSLAFAIGGRYATRQLEGYTAHQWDSSKPLQWVARGFDVTLGHAIEQSVKLGARLGHTPEEAAAIAKRAVTFRTKLNGGLGRSYGAEVVGVTFDFAMASVGDATVRNVIETLDPNTKKSWLVNDKGEAAEAGEKKHVDFGKMVKGLGTTTWRILSKNQGEDWFAGIMYVFQMKAQRYALNNAFGGRWRGHDKVFDENLNGGVYKLNNAGTIVGDYQLPGAMDLHWRFVGYNWYTLMFREGYDQIAAGFEKWKHKGFAIQPHVPGVVEHPLASAAWLSRYVTKSFIKANLYMQPAVLLFWPFRSSQSKWRGGAIHPDAPNLGGREAVAEPFSLSNYEHYPNATIADKMEKGFSQMLNPIGWAAYQAGSAVHAGSNKIFTKAGTINNFLGPVGSMDRQLIARNYVNAAFAYTPYMWAKAETALRIDERPPNGDLGQMDKAIYKLMHEAAHFQLKDVWATTKEIAKLSTHFDTGDNLNKNDPTSPITPATDPKTFGVPMASTVASKPQTTVQPQGRVRHDPIALDAANENFATANDNGGGSKHVRATATEGAAKQHDRRWAESVTGRALAGQFQLPPTTTRH